MSTPVATIADALIAFILSLLRDPAAVEEFDAAPKAVMASKGLAGRVRGGRPGGQARHRRPPARCIVKPVPPSAPAAAARPAPTRTRSSRRSSAIINQFATIDNRHDDRRPVHEPEHLDRGRRCDADLRPGGRRGFGRRSRRRRRRRHGRRLRGRRHGRRRLDRQHDQRRQLQQHRSTTRRPTTDVADDGAAADAAEDPSDAAAIAGAAVEDRCRRRRSTPRRRSGGREEPVAEAPCRPAEDPLAADLTAADTYESEDAGTAVVDDAYVEEPAEEQ